jgi:hypothetical protein
MRLILVLVFALLSSHQSKAVAANLESIRTAPDGGGPSHIFWLNGPAPGAGGKDIVAVVDPLFAAIRLFDVRRIVEGQNDSLSDRIDLIGVCALPVDFRPWRIHHLKDEVRIEGMPEAKGDPHNAAVKDFSTKLYKVNRALVSAESLPALKKAAALIPGVDWNPAPPTKQCGELGAAGPVGRDAQFSAKRRPNFPLGTIFLTNKPTALTSVRELEVRARTGPKEGLYSAKELEPAGSSRIVQITEAVDSADGVLRFSQRLLAYDNNSQKVTTEITFDDRFLRYKIGQRPLAVMPSGELLAMGNDRDGDFNIQSCGKIGAIQKNNVCAGSDVVRSENDPNIPKPGDQIIADANQQAVEKLDVGGFGAIFNRAKPFYTREWKVNTSGLPGECRSAAGCPIDGRPPKQAFVPLRGIRLAHGPYVQIGAPYAQTDTLGPAFDFMDKSSSQALAQNPDGFAAALRDVVQKGEGVPGNLNDHFKGELGIDCSALIQVAWNGAGKNPAAADRLSTGTLQKYGASYICKGRLPNADFLRPGDAIGLAVKSAAHHVVLYGAPFQFDGASYFWLVLESASACDGVCWSVYDPSFFNGWGVYRAKGRKDFGCVSSEKAAIEDHPIPADFDAWQKLVATPVK